VVRPFLDLPEAVGRSIEALRVYDDPPYGSEVQISFSDGTQLSISLQIEASVHAKHYVEKDGDLKILQEHQRNPEVSD
jgi:hypothetical protein